MFLCYLFCEALDNLCCLRLPFVLSLCNKLVTALEVISDAQAASETPKTNRESSYKEIHSFYKERRTIYG